MVTTPSSSPVPVEPPKPQVEQTWRPTVAGVLNIVAGALGIISGVILAFMGTWIVDLMDLTYNYGTVTPNDRAVIQAVIQLVLSILAISGIIYIIMGILTLIGGIYTTKRKKWGLGLAASIIAILLTLVLGILSTIFISQAKKEFS